MFVTGGAEGADRHWLEQCIRFHYNVDVYSFPGHRRSLPRDASKKLRVVEGNRLDRFERLLAAVGRLIGRSPSEPGSYTYNLLARNMWISEDTDCIVAVGFIQNGMIHGGTAWACYNHLMQGKPVWFLDQDREKCLYSDSFDGEWIERSITKDLSLPSSEQRIGVIGTRSISEWGKAMIENWLSFGKEPF